MRIGPFVKRKEIWMPTWRGWLTLLVTVSATFIIVLFGLAPFLSPVKPIGAPVLVMEGWVSEAGIRRAIELNEKNHYALVISCGMEIDKGMDISQYGTYANLGAARLVNLGFKGTNLITIPTPKSKRDRTYHTALAVHSYLVTNTTHRQIDLLSDSVHARRSWLLFSKACAPEIKVGIMSNRNPEFDSDHWWSSSNGVRTVLNEAIAYVYARLVFNPE